MIIKLSGATFTKYIGTVDASGTVTKKKVTLTITTTPSGATVKINGTVRNSIEVDYGTSVTYEVSMDGYVKKSGSIVVMSTGSTMTQNITLRAVGSTEPEEPETGGGSGGTTSNYTFTINPTPSTATVKLTASGYNQSSNSISVAAGTIVSWEVSATGYDTIKGSHTINETKSLDVEITNLTNAEKIDTSLANLVDGKWITVENGKEKELTAWRVTNFVEIPSNATHVYSNDITLYRANGNNTTPYAFYDAEQNYVSGIPLDIYPANVQVPGGTKGKWRGVLKWAIPEGVKYVRVCWTFPGSGYLHELTGNKERTVASPDVYFLKNN